jgi:hypothetical protein
MWVQNFDLPGSGSETLEAGFVDLFLVSTVIYSFTQISPPFSFHPQTKKDSNMTISGSLFDHQL